MVNTLYNLGYERAEWATITQMVNRANPNGKQKTNSRVKSAMRETHWTNLLKANNDGRFPSDQLNMLFPDMGGPVTTDGPGWTSTQKQIIWSETFSFAEKNVE
jgi:hypothetical protein